MLAGRCRAALPHQQQGMHPWGMAPACTHTVLLLCADRQITSYASAIVAAKFLSVTLSSGARCHLTSLI